MMIRITSIEMILGLMQDTGDYTEVDPSNVITINSNVSVSIASDLDETGYLYKDEGVDVIEDFSLNSTIDIISILSNGRNYAQSVSTVLGSANSWTDAIGIRYRNSVGDMKIQVSLVTIEGGVTTLNNSLLVGVPTLYANLFKVGTHVGFELYSDQNRTSLVVNLTATLSTDETYQYIYWCATDNVAVGGRLMSIVIDRLNYKTGEEPIIPDIPLNLFGAGFNNTTPIIKLYWSHNLINTNLFEVQNSTDTITWEILGYSIVTNYNDTDVINGTKRYYQVRACNNNSGIWGNSTFSLINYERVYFILGGGATITYITIPQSELNLMNIILPLIVLLVIVALIIAFKG